jgi:hypothetical protein
MGPANRLSLLDAAQFWRMLAREAAKTEGVPAGTEPVHIRS